mgnify:CR=1 FL=1
MFFAGPKFKNPPASKLVSDFRPFDPGIILCYHQSFTDPSKALRAALLPRSLAGYSSSASSASSTPIPGASGISMHPFSKRSGSFTILSSAPFKQKPGSSWMPRFWNGGTDLQACCCGYRSQWIVGDHKDVMSLCQRADLLAGSDTAYCTYIRADILAGVTCH